MGIKDKIIAFVPVRGGSKSIPLKNIKELCGKPLVYWCLFALQESIVDEIIVATDSDRIEEIVYSFGFSKVKIYHRTQENASDSATTESVMLEYIHHANLHDNDLLLLVQATSPLTETYHFNEAIELYLNGKYDSLLTCVRNYRFFWNENGTSKNYEYMNRPRRQDFKGELMENGAFYINKVENIVRTGNRLSNKIGIYKMPDYTAYEIDEPDDWIILESIMQRNVLSKYKTNKKSIKLFLCDVDGTLTDSGMYYSEGGDELKKFNTRDGMGFQLLHNLGIKTGIITSEDTKIVGNRTKKLKVDFLKQGKRDGDKLTAAMNICKELGISLEEVAYIGDDINCFNLLSAVGLKACPADADDKIINIPNIQIMKKKGGGGCVREFINLIINT